MQASFATLFVVLFMVILSFIQMSGIYNVLLNVAPGERERDQGILCKKKKKEKYFVTSPMYCGSYTIQYWFIHDV